MRILYGVAGEGMGHATRAKAVLDSLTNRHDVRILSGSRAFEYLQRRFRAVHRIFGFHIIYWDNSVSDLGILLYTFVRAPLLAFSFLKVLFLALTWKPQLIITDYDPFTCYVGWLFGIPVVSISNQHILNKTHVSYPRRYAWEAFKTRLVNALLIPHAALHVITTFSFPRANNAMLVPPIVRKELLRIRMSDSGPVLVYQTSKTNKRLVSVLRQLPGGFVVYGFGKRPATGNVLFKEFNETEFFKDIASCKAVITNGGYSLISEAVTLGKPVLAEPVAKQFEQTLNALLLEKEGYGRMAAKIDVATVASFLAHLDGLKRRFSEESTELAGAEVAAGIIERFIQRISSGVRRSSVPAPFRAGTPWPFQLKH
ncbi:UDP-glucuronosyltransferase [Candidatus Woesearchaeota archaeon]|nr:UDP-glucuronosyltransferase [Candidatus Woesearchaeota archaeon]